MVITLLTTLAGLGLGLWRGDMLLFGLLGLVAGRVIALELGIRALKAQLARLAGDRLPTPTDARPTAATTQDARDAEQSEVQSAPASSASSEGVGIEAGSRPLELDWPAQPTPRSPAIRIPLAEAWTEDVPTPNWLEQIRDWLTAGNLFVRIGVLLVFLGVGFLIKYAVDQQWLVFTLAMRLAAVAGAGLLLMGLGWVLRRRQRDYGLLLQGAAIGILYLDTYGAFQLAGLLAPAPAFALMALIGLAAAGLAVVQNAASLAWLGFAGGFLAPLITSPGGEDHVALFSYYALLNAAVLAVAWHRSWRALSLLGLGSTFAIAVHWGVLRYDPSRFASTEPFLILYFLFYVAISVLYAVRQPPRLRGYVDASLVFGTPILAFACQVELVRHVEHGIAWSAAVMGLSYLVLAWSLTRFAGPGLKLLTQAFGVLGIVFLSVAVPFALAADTTAGVWALEGAALVWIGTRQDRALTRALGLLLQAGAAIALIAGLPYDPKQPFFNGLYLGAAMLGAAAVGSAYWLDRGAPSRRGWERGGPAWLMVWGLSWWLGAGWTELVRIDPDAGLPAGILWYWLLTLVILELLASRLTWPRLHWPQTLAPALGIIALALSLGRVEHPAVAGGALAWPLLIAASYLQLWRMERRDPRGSLAWAHVALALLIVALSGWELTWRALEQLHLREGWRIAAAVAAPLAGLVTVTWLETWPVSAWRFAYRALVGGALVLTLAFWSLWSVGTAAGSAPFPWIPLLNPLDGAFAVILLAIWAWWRRLLDSATVTPLRGEGLAFDIAIGCLALLWINLVLLRTLHHLWLIPYEAYALYHSDLVQTAVAILWASTGVSLLVMARVRQSRPLWVGGALILAAVVLKLLAIDLAASGTLERIVSFLAVGALLVAIGWWSPLPARRTTTVGTAGNDSG